MRYRYYQTGPKTVICISSYAKKPVKATATCAPEDEFDLEKGKAIAKAKVDIKVAQKRINRALAIAEEIHKLLEYAEKLASKNSVYLKDSMNDLDRETRTLERLSKREENI